MLHPQSLVSSRANLGNGVRVEAGAVVEAEVQLGDGVTVGPCAYLARAVRVGAETTIGAGAVLLEGVSVGQGCAIEPGAVLGSRGFGFVQHEGRHLEIPQVGGVDIGDGTVVGTNACVDRGTTGNTTLGEGVRVGPLSQVGHNSRLGDRVDVGPQVAIAGSTVIEQGCTLGAQSAVTGHCHVGANSKIGDKSGVTRKSVPPGSDLLGFPARARVEQEQAAQALGRLPELVRQLEERST